MPVPADGDPDEDTPSQSQLGFQSDTTDAHTDIQTEPVAIPLTPDSVTECTIEPKIGELRRHDRNKTVSSGGRTMLNKFLSWNCATRATFVVGP